ncbi:hypothetical protein FISHEDRAFT_57366 [Fistulina hepatica ATCC 64428]|uniref:Pentatricopeptide repeat-containing protein n=1 Tax=Fistulina hepatica ATCC 64428 TaxID=1128425 RepID=A0A0D7AHC4_9AGAR|nr:hypothetical protein FISHEDRAFT_57366 [Fistulina hepatica ATCC 64428]
MHAGRMHAFVPRLRATPGSPPGPDTSPLLLLALLLLRAIDITFSGQRRQTLTIVRPHEYFDALDPGRSTDAPIYDPAPPFGTPVAADALAHPPPTLPPSVSKSGLYRNLVHMLSAQGPPVDLRTMIDYHNMLPRLRSVQSFNLLIGLAIKHYSLGIAQSLLHTMQADSIPGNLETLQLTIRVLVRAGWWERALDVAATKLQLSDVYLSTNDHGLPALVWAEFLAVLHRRPFRTRLRRHSLGPSRTDVMPALSLPQGFPLLTPPEISKPHPRLIYTLSKALLLSNRKHFARELAATYLRDSQLPRAKHVAWASRIIDLFVLYEPSTKGLHRFHQAHTAMLSFLSCHPVIRPSSMTLFHLLGHLRNVKMCGTLAAYTLQNFENKWGRTAMSTSRVRRRVAAFCLKEGRWDIANRLLQNERRTEKVRARWRMQCRVIGHMPKRPRRRTRPSVRRNNGSGRKRYRWHKVVARFKRLVENCPSH